MNASLTLTNSQPWLFRYRKNTALPKVGSDQALSSSPATTAAAVTSAAAAAAAAGALEVDSEDGGPDDEESGGEDSDEEALNNKLCTFTITQKEFMNQHW